MSLFLDGIGAVLKKAGDWFPGKKESKENQIAKLLEENRRLSNETPLQTTTAQRISDNATRVKQLRAEIARIT